MNIFEKRPLSLILCIILGGFSLFALSTPPIRIILISISTSALVVCAVVKRFRRTSYIFHISLLALSFLLSFTYFNYLFYPSEHYNKSVDITGEVIEVDYNDNYAELDVKCTSIDQSRIRRKLKVYLYQDDARVDVGDVIAFNAKLESFDDNGDFDFNKYYTAKGFSAITSVSDITIISEGAPPISHKFASIRHAICERATALCGEDTAALLCAGLLGEKNMLQSQLKLDFQRIGISHILAISGMHLAILVGLLEFLLSALRVGRRTRIVLECIFTLAYMALTGFPLSVCRAGIMLIISSILYLISGCKDSITSLFVALLLIIIYSPYSALDIGLWLSVLATLGILIAVELVDTKYSEAKGLRRFLLNCGISLIFSVFAICTTSVISVFNFRFISDLSVISTLIFSFLFELFIYVGIAVLIFGNLIPLAPILCEIANLIETISGGLSKMSFICASSSFASVKIIFIICSIVFIGSLYKLYKNI